LAAPIAKLLAVRYNIALVGTAKQEEGPVGADPSQTAKEATWQRGAAFGKRRTTSPMRFLAAPESSWITA
jgi:hypothetical protein